MYPPQGPGTGPQPPMPTGPQPPPKKKHTGRNVALGVLGAAVLVFGGCTAMVVSATGSSPQSSAQPVAVDSPTATAHHHAKKIKVPDVVGMNGQDASDKLDKLGFTNVQTGSDNGDVPIMLTNWTVKAQSVKAGTKVPTDRSLTLTLARPDGSESTSGSDNGGDQPVADESKATIEVTGSAPSGVTITYGSDGSNHSGHGLPFHETVTVPADAMFEQVTAQLMGGGHIRCKITIGDTTKSGDASGGYNICSAQLNNLGDGFE